MRTHILIALIALLVSACASNSNVTSSGQSAKTANQYGFADQGSRFR